MDELWSGCDFVKICRDVETREKYCRALIAVQKSLSIVPAFPLATFASTRMSSPPTTLSSVNSNIPALLEEEAPSPDAATPPPAEAHPQLYGPLLRLISMPIGEYALRPPPRTWLDAVSQFFHVELSRPVVPPPPLDEGVILHEEVVRGSIEAPVDFATNMKFIGGERIVL